MLCHIIKYCNIDSTALFNLLNLLWSLDQFMIQNRISFLTQDFYFRIKSLMAFFVFLSISTIYNGYFSDSSRMFCIGNVSPEKEKLVRVTKECVEIGISKVKPWEPIGNMGHAVHMHALENGYTIVKEIGGHGVGLEFHEDPWVSYTSEENSGVIMEPGMMFTIEPMVNMGSDEVYTDEEDDWTVRTEDGMPSAQWEITVLVTEDGCEVICW